MKFDPLNPKDESKLYCPHCGEEQLNNEDESWDIETGLDVCEKCDKEFWMSRKVTFEYDSWIEDGEANE